MKNKPIILTACAVLFLIFGSATASYGQDEPIVGGYGKTDVKSADVIAAAEFAVKKGAKKEKATVTLVSIQKVRRQVVAGINYELCLEITVKRKSDKTAVKRYVKTIVYRNLKNRYSLTRWMSSADPPEC